MWSAAKHLGVSDRRKRRILNTRVSYDNYIYMFEVLRELPIVVVNKQNNDIKQYFSIRTAAKDMHVGPPFISDHINTNKLLKGIYLITRKVIN
jgi:hypothetical protein